MKCDDDQGDVAVFDSYVHLKEVREKKRLEDDEQLISLRRKRLLDV